MKIARLTIDNYLGIKKLKVDKFGKINFVTGGNGAGKTSLQKAIEEAFKSSGKDYHVIHKDADKAEVCILLDNGIEIERKITPSNNTVKVVKDGESVSQPATFLKALLGESYFGFNPVQFVLQKPAERRKMLLSSIDVKISPDFLKDVVPDDALLTYITENGFDYEKHGLEVLEEMQAKIYAKRKEQNLHVTRLKKALEQDRADLPKTVDPERFKGFDFNKKMNDLRDAESEVNQYNADVKELNNLGNRFDRIDEEIKELQSKIALLEAQKAQLDKAGQELNAKIHEFQAPDVVGMREEIEEYQANTKIIAKIEEIERREKGLEEETEIHEDLDALYKILANEAPKRLLANAKLPADNVEIKGDDILVDGVQLEKLNTQRKVEFAVNVAKSLCGKLKVICIDDFEHMDRSHREAFIKAAEGDDFEYFIATVTDGELKVESSEPATKQEQLI